MAIIHFILQGKGGVGKSMVATLLYQYLQENDKEIIAFDTDPVNATFASFKEFNVKRLELMQDDNIDARKFDPLLEDLAEASEHAHIIVDNGASSFVVLCSYIIENDMINLLKDNNHTIYFHTIITGGQAMGDTIVNLKKLVLAFSTSQLIIWLNPFFGEIQMDGKSFEDFKVYEDHSHQFKAIIKLPLGNRNLIGKDLEELFAKRQSFKAGINSSLPIAVRSRLNRYWNQIKSCIELAEII